jgi:hypothetical protein
LHDQEATPAGRGRGAQSEAPDDPIDHPLSVKTEIDDGHP